MAEIEHPHLSVMFTDIKGYSRLMSENEARALQMLAEHNEVMETVIAEHSGRIVKKLGDAYMVVFETVEQAAGCGLQALSRIAARNRHQRPAMEIRVGVHAGSMLERDGDFFGENVNIAARLEQMASPMAVATSERVVQDLATRIPAEARFVGAHALKNLRYPVSVYQLTPADDWKLYLSADATAADHESQDVLGDIAGADAAWRRVDAHVMDGDLQTACRLAEAALSRFGGSYDQYAHLAAYYLVSRSESEAQSALRLGDMLGERGADAEQYDWLQALVSVSEEFASRPADEQSECLTRAGDCVARHPHDLPMRVLVEGLKSRVTGHLQGLATLAQQNSNSALVLRGYAEALKDQHRQADAERLLEQAIAVAPEVAEHQLRRVQWMVDGGEIEAVREESETLSRKFPADPRVYEWTGKTRLLTLDPHGAQWIFEQAREVRDGRGLDSTEWLTCSLIQQGRFEAGVEQARKAMRHAFRQNHRHSARACLRLAAIGAALQHWDGVVEVLEEYKRYDPDWIVPRAGIIAAKHARGMIPWERTLEQLGELALGARPGGWPHPSGLTVVALLPTVEQPEYWSTLSRLEFMQSHRDWIIEKGHLDAAQAEARCAARCAGVEPWHGQLVPLLTQLRNRLDARLPSLLALAGLIEARLGRFEAARPLLEQARKMWRNADWPVWEIQEAEAVLAAGAAPVTGQGGAGAD